MTNVYVSKAGWSAVTPWAASAIVTLGTYRRQLAAVTDANARVFKCTTIGTTGASEPAWVLTNNGTTSDNGVVWTQVGGQEANQSAGNWTAPLADVTTACTLISGATGVNVFVSSDHAQTPAAAYALNPANFPIVISVSRTGSTLPPTVTDDLAGASIITSGISSNITVGALYMRGFTLTAGAGANLASITLGNGNSAQTVLENCALALGNSNAGSVITTVSNISSPGSVILDNTTISFGSTSQTINIVNAVNMEWRNTASTPAVIGSVPAHLFTFVAGGPVRYASLHGLDLSNVSTDLFTGTPLGQVDVYDCKLNASMTITSRIADDFNSWVRVSNCDSSSADWKLNIVKYSGHLIARLDAAMVGGASDGTNTYGHMCEQFANNTTNNIVYPFDGLWIPQRFNTTGTSKTVTMEAICFFPTAPDNSMAWMEVEALTNASYPLGPTLSGRVWPAAPAGTALATTTTDWTNGTPARANSTAYNLNDTIKLASNPGRLFLCVQVGTSASSEPGGYASAIDGGLVTDGSAAFRAGWRVKFTQVLTPQLAGIIRARVRFTISTGNASHLLAYNPSITIT